MDIEDGDAILDKALQDATPLAKAANRAKNRAAGPRLIKAIERIDAIAKPIEDILAKLTSLPTDRSIPGLGWQRPISPRTLSLGLIEKCAAGDVRDAKRWLSEIVSIEEAGAAICGVFFGISVRNKIKFSNGVTLLPVEGLPRSRTTRNMLRGLGRSFGAEYLPVPHAAYITEPKTWNLRSPGVAGALYRESKKACEIIDAFTMFDDCAAFHYRGWVEYESSDIQFFERSSYIGNVTEVDYYDY